MQPETFTLPHSGLKVPHTGYAVTSYREHKSWDGVAFTATLRLNGKIVGTIDNEGRGGPDTFHPTASTAEGYRDNRDAVQAFAAHCIRNGEPTDLEWVLGDLVTEYENTRDIKKAAKAGNVLLRMMEDWRGDDEQPMRMPSAETYFAIPAAEAADRAKLARRIAKTADMVPHDLAWWQLWDAETNEWVDITERPAHLKEQTR